MIEILYFEGCPNREPTVELAREVAADLGISAEIREVAIRDTEEAERRGFLGSPSVRVHGVDIEPGAARRTDYTYGCRIYGDSGVPPREFLVAALEASNPHGR